MSRTYHHGHRNKQKKFGDNWRWMWSEPKEWRKYKKHRVRRREVANKLNEVMRGNEDVIFPLDKKPWIYYW